MPLRPPEDGQSFESLQDLILRVNEHAAPEGYAVVMTRTKKSKLGVTRKAWLICDRGGRIRAKRGEKRQHTASRCIECPFSLIAQRIGETEGWSLEVVNAAHNHGPTLAGSHPVHRKMAMTAEVQSEISRALTVQQAPSQILSSLRIPDPVTGISHDDPSDPRPVNPLFKPRDIYNFKGKLRRETLGPLTPIQALIQELDVGD